MYTCSSITSCVTKYHGRVVNAVAWVGCGRSLRKTHSLLHHGPAVGCMRPRTPGFRGGNLGGKFMIPNSDLTRVRCGLLQDDIAFKKKQAEDKKALKEAAAGMGKKKKK